MDTLQRFSFEHAPVRGEVVHLSSTWQQVLRRHDYPPLVRRVLGEFFAASALLSATLKFSGSMVMQARSSGPIKLMVVECTSDGDMRAVAQWENIPDNAPLSDLFGSGRLVITIDPHDSRERYQGIVELSGNSVAEVLEHYLRHSEQLSTNLWLAADRRQASGVLLQRLPEQVYDDEDTWQRAVLMTNTLSERDLFSLSAEKLIRQLYRSDDVRLYRPSAIRFQCSCTRSKVENVLRMLGYDEVQSILAEQQSVRVNCEFCNERYRFDSVDVEQLFHPGPTLEGSAIRH